MNGKDKENLMKRKFYSLCVLAQASFFHSKCRIGRLAPSGGIYRLTKFHDIKKKIILRKKRLKLQTISTEVNKFNKYFVKLMDYAS